MRKERNLRLEGTYAGLGTITEYGCVMIVTLLQTVSSSKYLVIYYRVFIGFHLFFHLSVSFICISFLSMMKYVSF